MSVSIVAGAIVVGILALMMISGLALTAFANGARRRLIWRLAEERTSDTGDAFAHHMQQVGVPTDVSNALYKELGRAVGQGVPLLPVRADDDLRVVYAMKLPDEENEFMDNDLREVVQAVARRTGRVPPDAGPEVDRELRQLRTVLELARWISLLPTA